jgi:hypothetical protein
MNENSTLVLSESGGSVPNDDQLDPAPVAPCAPLPAIRDPGPENCSFVRQSGGQPGNQNARKHGLYSRYLPPKQREDYEEARQIKGVGPERALLRAKLAEMLEKDPDNVDLVNKVIRTIIKLEAARPETDALRDAQQKADLVFAQLNDLMLANPNSEIGKRIRERWAREDAEED